VAVASYNTDAAIADAGYALLPSISEADLEQRMVDECLEVAALVVRLSRMLLQTRSVTTQSYSSGGGGGGNVDAEINSKDGSSTSCSTGKDETIELASSSIPTSECVIGSAVFAVFHQQRRAAEVASLIQQRLEMPESSSSSSSSPASAAAALDSEMNHRDRYWAWHSTHRSLTGADDENGRVSDMQDGAETESSEAAHEDETERFFGVSERGAQHAAMRMHLLMRLAFDSHIDVLIALAEKRLALCATAGRERMPNIGCVRDTAIASTPTMAPFSLVLQTAALISLPLISPESSPSSASMSAIVLILPSGVSDTTHSLASIHIAPAFSEAVLVSSNSSSSSSSSEAGAAFSIALAAPAVVVRVATCSV
jgi:hypothetical protein